MVIGLPSGKQGNIESKKLKRIARKHAGHPVQIFPWAYFEDREKLFKELSRKSVCIVPSVYEGFGLVGMEAISAEVPLIISKNSGLFEFIDEQFPGATGCLESIKIQGSLEDDYLMSDVGKISKKIGEISNNIKKAKQKAIALRKIMQPVCTWENCASAFAKSLDIEIDEVQGKELCSKDNRRKICMVCDISEDQLDEMYDNIKRFYGF